MADITDPVCMREVTEHGEGAMVNQYCTSNAHFVSRKKYCVGDESAVFTGQACNVTMCEESGCTPEKPILGKYHLLFNQN